MSSNLEQLSELMDAESASQQDVEDLLQAKENHDSWASFHLIRDLLQNKTAEYVAPNLHLRIAEAIAEEPTLLVPEARKEMKNWRQKLTQWGEQLTSYAIAASVTTFILYSVQQIQTPLPENSSAITTLQLIEPSEYQIANTNSPLQEKLLDFTRMSSIYGSQVMAPYVQGVNYSNTITLKPITEKKVLEVQQPTESEVKTEEQSQQHP